jgi:hypothetical protein
MLSPTISLLMLVPRPPVATPLLRPVKLVVRDVANNLVVVNKVAVVRDNDRDNARDNARDVVSRVKPQLC